MPRVTILDVARTAGISKGAASHALNGRPGVSEATRLRVQQAANELGWSANPTARALAGARAGAIGWVIVRSPKSETIDPYFIQLFSGVEVALADTDVAFVVKLVDSPEEEMRLYRRWSAERRVDGLVLTDLDVRDSRFALLEDLGMPSVAVRDTIPEDAAFPSPNVWTNERVSARLLLNHAGMHGHRRIAWISGDRRRHSVQLRRQMADEWASERPETTRVLTVDTDLSAEQGIAEAFQMLKMQNPPTCIIFDNDLMAVAAVGSIENAGLRIPEDLSVMSFIDSPLCGLPHAPLTALHHPIVKYGELVAARLLSAIEGAGQDIELPHPRLVERASVRDVAHDSKEPDELL